MTYGGKATFADQVEADTWAILIPDEPQQKTSGLYTITASTENCLPFGETFAGKQKAWGMSRKLVDIPVGMGSLAWFEQT